MKKEVPISQPTIPPLERLMTPLKKIFASRSLTNGVYVRTFEARLKKSLGVDEAVCVASATSGLILVVQALELDGEVLVPSFTFPATTHALVWNNLKPVFVECDPHTFNIDVDDLERKITPRTSAIMGVHVFGNPVDMERLTSIARRHRLKVVIDGAHALGSEYRGKSVACFGDATVFSLAPTKLVTSGEGGIIATGDARLAKVCRLTRNYGNPPGYNCQYIGLNARMSEIHAVIGLESFKSLPQYIRVRNRLAGLYRKHLSGIKGFSFQQVSPHDLSTYNYCAFSVNEQEAGMSCSDLHHALLQYGIHTKRYFYPAVHQQDAYKPYAAASVLPITESVSSRVLCVPLFSHIEKKTVEKICGIIKNIIRGQGSPGIHKKRK